MNLKNKIKKLSVEQSSSWSSDAKNRAENRGALRNSQLVALKVLDELDKQGISQTELAARMEVSRQQVSKIVKGQENLTFETIDKLENALGLKLLHIEAVLK